MSDNGLTVFPDRLVRFTGADLEVRAGNGGRTVYGTLVPYDKPTSIGGMYSETFPRGAFEKTISERGHRVKLTIGHAMDRLPIGRATELREDPDGLVGSFYVSETQEGDDALQRVRDGAVDSFSIEFQPRRSEWSPERDAVVRREVQLLGASLVAYPAYESALVAGVRSVMDVTAAMEAHPELRQQIETLIRSYADLHELTDDAATAGTSTALDGTPLLAGHLSDTHQQQADAIRALIARLTGGTQSGPGREDTDPTH